MGAACSGGTSGQQVISRPSEEHRDVPAQPLDHNPGSPVSVISVEKEEGQPHSAFDKHKRGGKKRTVQIVGDPLQKSDRRDSAGHEVVKGSAGGDRTQHSTSAPHFHPDDLLNNLSEEMRPHRARAQSVSHHPTEAEAEDISEGELRTMVRSLTRKASGSASGERAMIQALKNRRKSSQIEDEQVLRLIQEKQQEGRDVPQGLKLDKKKTMLQFEEVAEMDPKLAERISQRRKTMEHLDIFSPDIRHDRIEELFDASEKYIASTGAPIISTPIAPAVDARPQQPRRKTLKPPVATDT